MEARVTRIEEWAKVSDQRLGRIEAKLDVLPTKTDMLGMFLAVFVVLGLVLAGLGWLETRAARIQAAPSPPIIIQMPTPPAANTPSKPG